MNDLATIWTRVAPVREDGGLSDLADVVEATEVPCRLAPLDLRLPGAQAVADQYGGDVKFVIKFKAGTLIAPGRYFEITGISNGTPFRRDLEMIGDLVSNREIEHLVYCKTLSVPLRRVV
jgi:hypothetical protein